MDSTPAKSSIIVIDGLWGCGKTTLALRLAQRLGAVPLIFDDYREHLFDSGSFEHDKDHPELNRRSLNQLLSDLALILKSRRLAVVEWDFERELVQERLAEFGANHFASFVTLHLHADVKTRIRRALMRLWRRERHQVHVGRYARIRKVVGLLLPARWIPGPRDKVLMNLGGVVIKQEMRQFGDEEYAHLCAQVARALEK